MTDRIDLSRAFVNLSNDGDAQPIELTPQFWRESTKSARYDRVVGVLVFDSPEDLHPSMQEMHPGSDEILFLVSGALDVVLQEGHHERRIALEAGEAAIVPRGVWHRLAMREPGKLLFINTRTGMESREARTGER